MFVSGELKEFTVSDQDGFPIYTDGSPIFEVSSLSRADKERLVWKVNELLKSGYLERSNSEWSSPVRPKTINGKLEICVDYRSLNAITQDYEDIVLPTIPDVLSSISQSNIFSKVYLRELITLIVQVNLLNCWQSELIIGSFSLIDRAERRLSPAYVGKELEEKDGLLDRWLL